jgi:hypothetical protein
VSHARRRARHPVRRGPDLGPAVAERALDPVHVAEELVHERRRRPVVDLLRRTHLLDPAAVHHHHPIRQLQGLLLVVGHEHAGQAHVVVQAPQPAAQLLAHLGVQRAERLVQQQHARLDGERARQRHPLPLAARELRRVAPREVVELHEAEQLRHLRADLRLHGSRAARPHPEPEGHILEYRHVAKQRVVLEHEPDRALADRAPARVLAVEQHPPRGRELQPGDDPEQRRLARAGRPEQRHQLARLHREAHPVERGEPVEALHDVADLDGHRFGPFPLYHRRAAASSAR